MAFFTVSHTSSKIGSRARTGVIQTAHGLVQTPAFVSVGTKATIKSLTPAQAREIGTQLSFVNTYHLVVHPGSEVVQKQGSVHSFSQMDWSLMSDSGGFQVFSLAQRARRAKLRHTEEAILVALNEDRVIFRSLFDGSLIEFSPEISMTHQHNIGADLIMSFDECTYYPATHDYALKAMQRTHHWLNRCIDHHSKKQSRIYPQHLYGIIQGATYEDLRVESAKYVCSQPTDGIAIGGVSVGETKKELRDQVTWVSPFLPIDRPVHLLGVGHIDDIIDLVSKGIDTFDCVEPSRLARLGILLFINGLEKPIAEWNVQELDIQELKYKEDARSIPSHSPYVGQFTYGFLHHLFKQKELLGYTLSTMHNLSLMEALMIRIREEIERNNI